MINSENFFLTINFHEIRVTYNYVCIKIRNYDSVKISKNWRNMKQPWTNLRNDQFLCSIELVGQLSFDKIIEWSMNNVLFQIIPIDCYFIRICFEWQFGELKFFAHDFCQSCIMAILIIKDSSLLHIMRFCVRIWAGIGKCCKNIFILCTILSFL